MATSLFYLDRKLCYARFNLARLLGIGTGVEPVAKKSTTLRQVIECPTKKKALALVGKVKLLR